MVVNQSKKKQEQEQDWSHKTIKIIRIEASENRCDKFNTPKVPTTPHFRINRVEEEESRLDLN